MVVIVRTYGGKYPCGFCFSGGHMELESSGQTRVQRPELAGKMRVGPRSVVGDRSGTRALRSVQKVGKPPF